MQKHNWDDLRYLLAVHRGRTFSAAARMLSVDDTTVARRLKALQKAIGTDLLRRMPDGSLELNKAGQKILARAERMEHEAQAIDQDLGDACQTLVGTVRITSVPILTNRLLVPALPPLLSRHPGLAIELVPAAQNLSLTRREADLAVRLGRPKLGGAQVKVRRIGMLAYGIFAAKTHNKEQVEALAWITYEESTAHLPQSKWTAEKVISGDFRIAALRVADAETAMQAAICGLGKAVLPIVAGASHPQLQSVAGPNSKDVLEREVWLLSHADQRNVKSVAVAMRWIESIDWSGV